MLETADGVLIASFQRNVVDKVGFIFYNKQGCIFNFKFISPSPFLIIFFPLFVNFQSIRDKK